MTHESMGKRIQRLRRERGLTQEQAAEALGVTAAAVSKWETGAACPDVAMLAPLARLLRVTVDGLLDFRPALTPEEIPAMLERSRRLFEEKRAGEAREAVLALLQEYPGDLNLCFTAGSLILHIRIYKQANRFHITKHIICAPSNNHTIRFFRSFLYDFTLLYIKV